MILFSLANPLLLFATYMVFAGQISESELLAALPASALAIVFTIAHRDNARRRFAMPAAAVPFALRSAIQILPDTVGVGWALTRVVFAGARASRGSVVEQPFRIGAASPQDAARRAVTTLGVSLAPNGYVLRVFAGDESLLIHRLVPVKVETDTEWPA